MPDNTQQPDAARLIRDPVRVLIVEDHPIMRYGMRCLLETEPNITVCGETGSDRMSPREFQVFVRLGRGMKPREMAREMNLSVKTIESSGSSGSTL